MRIIGKVTYVKPSRRVPSQDEIGIYTDAAGMTSLDVEPGTFVKGQQVSVEYDGHFRCSNPRPA